MIDRSKIHVEYKAVDILFVSQVIQKETEIYCSRSDAFNSLSYFFKINFISLVRILTLRFDGLNSVMK